MIFSVNNLKSENLNVNKAIFDDRPSTTSIGEDSSFFIESLNMILEENKNFAIQRILEAKNSTKTLFINNPDESLKVIDTRLENFIFNLNKLLNKFTKVMNRIGARTSLVKDHTVKDFSSIKNRIEYKNTLYNYTNIGFYNTHGSYETSINDIFSILIQRLEKFSKIKSSNDFEKLYNTISKDKDLDIGDEYRATILGKRTNSNEDKEKDSNEVFYSELRKFFCGDGDDSELESYSYDPKHIQMLAKSFYTNYNLKSITKEVNEMIKAAKNVQGQIKKLNLDDYISIASNKQDWYSHSAKCAFDSIVNDALYRTQILCNIYLRYIAAKMEAATKSREQDVKVLKYILKNKDKE